jgi:hypothetical protein
VIGHGCGIIVVVVEGGIEVRCMVVRCSPSRRRRPSGGTVGSAVGGGLS